MSENQGPPAKARSLAWACLVMGGSMLVEAKANDANSDAKNDVKNDATFSGAAIDSRAVKPGQLFFALPGERVDGFAFCAAAKAAGAAALVVSLTQGRPSGCEGLPVIAVPDVRRSLGVLAGAVRARFKGRVVGVTGSNGKTTTKELIAAALASAGTVLRTQGNLNTDVGLPLTVLGATEEEDFWVLEMAMRARGEIAYLANLGQPHVGVVTNVAGAHLERLGSLDEVARAKGEIFHGLAPDGIAVFPADDPRIEREAAHLPEQRKRRFAIAGPQPVPAHVRVLDFVPAGQKGSVMRVSVENTPLVLRLPLAGEHNARNAAAALAVVSALSLPLVAAATALEATVLPPHRSSLHMFGGRLVMDDCYNANPASMLAALRTVAAWAGTSARAYAVLGDMLELGPQTASQHDDVGREVARLGFAGMAAVGELASHIAVGAKTAGMASDRIVLSMNPDEAAAKVVEWSKPGDWVLVKASRGMRLERVMEALEKKLET